MALGQPLRVAFIWHMHQPFYKDTESGRYVLPWVRLHAVKDYLHIAEIIADFPAVRQTINVVPSLAEQLLDYAAGSAVDPHLAVSLKPSLTIEDKKFLLDQFFSINWDHFVWPAKRYAQLARLREAAEGDPRLLGESFWTDLIVWFNLAWIDPSTRQRDVRLKALEDKGRNFDRTDVITVLDYHREVCGKVLPAYRALAERGQIELTTTPYFHPILPLLIDTDSAREAHPDVELPSIRLAAPDDAAEHLARAIRFHQQTFGRRPVGVWPAEGGVSQAAIELISQFDVRWIATDEHVLARALGRPFPRDSYGHLLDPRPLYQPYHVEGAAPAVFFRDQTLSDRIGFVYQHMGTTDAVEDLIHRLRRMAEQLSSDPRPHVVSIILDGENCWEYYPNNGDDFLRLLFRRISQERLLETVTPSEYLDRFGATETLKHLPAASWIGASFDTWIGEPKQNLAWEYLALARSHLAAWEHQTLGNGRGAGVLAEEQTRRERARLALLIAEGSDWFWWYYSRNQLGGENVFDTAFRKHLANVYRATGSAVPSWLERPIDGTAPLRRKAVTGFLTPARLTAEDRASAEWAHAAFVEPDVSSGTMQQGYRLIRRVYYGFDVENLFFRIETTDEVSDRQIAIFIGAPNAAAANRIPRLDGAVAHDSLYSWRVEVNGQGSPTIRIARATGDGSWIDVDARGEAVVGRRAIEVRLDRVSLGIDWGTALHIAAGVVQEGVVIEMVPSRRAEAFLLSDVPETQLEGRAR